MKFALSLLFVFSVAGAAHAEVQDYMKRQPMTVGRAVEFPDFTIVYDGATEEKKESVPSKTRTDSYTVKSKEHGSQVLKVISGLKPPMPLDFSVGKKKFTLMTYTLPAPTIEPESFSVLKKP